MAAFMSTRALVECDEKFVDYVPALGFRPKIDCLRAIAIGGVLYAHFWNDASILGQLGVRLFFVLSGFLITDILLGLRRGNAAFSTPISSLFNFFVRRALRIWPAYYLAMIIALAFNVLDIRSVAGWHLTFTSNILFSLRNDHVPWVTSAWWSLSLEEQFYLIWPVAIVLPKRSALPWIVAALIGLGICFHVMMTVSGQRGLTAYYLPPAAFVALGTGALLALIRVKNGRISILVEWMGLLSVPVVASLLILPWPEWVWPILNVLPMAAAVSWAVRGDEDRLAELVRWRPLLWIGRISYGIYLYHLFVMLFLFSLGYAVLLHRGPLLFLAGATISIALASLSWIFLEGPANRLKRYFPYQRDTMPGAAA